MSPKRTEPEQPDALQSRAYEFTVDGGRESVRALSIEREDCETAWIISDTVRALDNMR